MLTDDPQWHYGKLPRLPERSRKWLFLADKNGVDGETATQLITIGSMPDREAFIDSLEGTALCFDGLAGLEKAFQTWIDERKSPKTTRKGVH